MKKIAIYCRVSTALQEQEKTVESQLAELREICKGFEIVAEYVDDGWSGATLMRPDLDRMREDSKKGLFEALYVISNDRLSRNLYHQGILVEELKKYNIEIFIKDKPIADTPDGRFVFNIMGAVAEYEKEKILERTKRGRIYKAKQKGIVGSTPPLGYNYIKKSSNAEGYYEINPEETEVVKLMFDLYIEYQSLYRVQKELNLRKIKTRKGGAQWSISVVGRTLRSEAYIGNGYYGKYCSIEVDNGQKYQRTAKAGRKKRDKAEWILINFPPIIDKEKFELVQETLSKRFKPYGVSKRLYLLSGLVKCGNCSSTYAGDTSKGYSCYRCNDRHRVYPFSKSCYSRRIGKDKLENAVWKKIKQVTTSRLVMVKYILKLAKKINKTEPQIQQEKEKILKSKRDIQAKKNRLLELYTEGNVEKAQFIEKNDELKQIEISIDKKIGESSEKLSEKIDESVVLSGLDYFCELAQKRLDSFKPEEKQQFLRDLINAVVFNSEERTATIKGELCLDTPNINSLFALNAGTLSQHCQTRATPC